MNRLSRSGARVAHVAWLLCAASVALAGCTSEIPEGGYLDDTSKLHEAEISEGMYVHFEDALAAYDRFTVAPLTFRFTPRRPRPVTLRDLEVAEAAYRSAVEGALAHGGRFTRAAGPGKGVLLLRGAVTDRFQRDEKDPGPGPATVELEAVDSLTKRRVFAVIDPAFAQRDSGGEDTSPSDAFDRFGRRLRARLDDARDAAARANRTR
jgi:hypothetical protein